MKRQRLLAILKLVGTLLCGLILTAMFINRYDWFDFDRRQLAVRFSGGNFAITWHDTTPQFPTADFIGPTTPVPQPSLRQLWCLNFPLWPLLVALGLPTLLLWRIDRGSTGSNAVPRGRAATTGRLHRRRARRRLLKRFAIAAFVAAALALLVSTRTAAVGIEPTGRCGVGITQGTLLLFYSVMPMQAFRPKVDVIEMESISWRGWFTGNPLTPVLPRYTTFGAATLKIVLIPLSSLLIALGLLSVSLWLLDFRRTSPNACPECNYDLTGNTSGVCPECGQPAENAA